jgi:hypothetical protein
MFNTLQTTVVPSLNFLKTAEKPPFATSFMRTYPSDLMNCSSDLNSLDGTIYAVRSLVAKFEGLEALITYGFDISFCPLFSFSDLGFDP